MKIVTIVTATRVGIVETVGTVMAVVSVVTAAVMSEYNKMDPNEYLNIFGFHTKLPNKYTKIFRCQIFTKQISKYNPTREIAQIQIKKQTI